MNPFNNPFERKWFCIMMLLYVFIMLPFPFHFNTEYQPLLWGIPNYIFGWLFNATVVMIAIIIWRKECLSRPEYQDLEDEQ